MANFTLTFPSVNAGSGTVAATRVQVGTLTGNLAAATDSDMETVLQLVDAMVAIVILEPNDPDPSPGDYPDNTLVFRKSS